MAPWKFLVLRVARAMDADKGRTRPERKSLTCFVQCAEEGINKQMR
jgi:hypothetical protein